MIYDATNPFSVTLYFDATREVCVVSMTHYRAAVGGLLMNTISEPTRLIDIAIAFTSFR